MVMPIAELFRQKVEGGMKGLRRAEWLHLGMGGGGGALPVGREDEAEIRAGREPQRRQDLLLRRQRAHKRSAYAGLPHTSISCTQRSP